MHDDILLGHDGAAAHVEAGVEQPEEEDEAGDGAEDDANDRARRGPPIHIRVGARDGDDLLSSNQTGRGPGR